MGIKMPTAFYKTEKRIITIDEARERIITKGLVCASSNCSAEIIYVGPTETKYESGKKGYRRAYFRLRNHQKHANDCKYNTTGRLSIIAKESEGIVNSVKKNEYEFRMNLLNNALNAGSNVKASGGETNNLKSDKSQKQFKRSGKVKPYLSSMKHILTLRSEMDNNNELEKHIKLKLAGSEIKWNKFYFEPSKFESFYRLVDSKSTDYPLAVEGEIYKITDPYEKFDSYSVKLQIPFGEKDRQGKYKLYSVSANIRSKEIAEIIKKDFSRGKTNFAFYAFFNTKRVEMEDRIYFNLYGRIIYTQQFHVFK